MAPRRPSTEAAVANTAARSDVRAAAGAPAAAAGPGSADPLVAGLRKAGLLRLLVLHLLGDGPSYGNQLMERVGDLTGGLVGVNPNTMYPLLRELEGRKLIEGKWEHPERRTRRYYSITREGKKEYRRLVEEVRPFLDSVHSSIEEIVREVYGG